MKSSSNTAGKTKSSWSQYSKKSSTVNGKTDTSERFRSSANPNGQFKKISHGETTEKEEKDFLSGMNKLQKEFYPQQQSHQIQTSQ